MQASPDRLKQMASQDKQELKQKMQGFMQKLLSDDPDSYHKLLDLVELLSGVEVDLRHLQNLKQAFVNPNNAEVAP